MSVTGGSALARGLGVPRHLIGTLLGSNITDPLFSLGLGAAVGGIDLAHRATAIRSATYMLVVSAMVVAFFHWRERITRTAGAVCLGLYLLSFTAV